MLTPPDIMAQALGVNASDVPPSLAARNSNAGFLTRMAAPPNDTLDAFRATSLLQPPQSATQVHRFPLAHGNTPQARANTPEHVVTHYTQLWKAASLPIRNPVQDACMPVTPQPTACQTKPWCDGEGWPAPNRSGKLPLSQHAPSQLKPSAALLQCVCRRSHRCLLAPAD